MKNYSPYKILRFALLFVLFCACSSTKYVPENEYLLNKVKIRTDKSELSKSEIKRNVRQRPNTRILGFMRSKLGIYNLSGRDEKKGINRWFRRMGEPPVIYNEALVHRSKLQIENYMRNKGYYAAQVIDTVSFRKKKATAEYTILAGEMKQIEEIIFTDKYSYTDNNLKEDSEVIRKVLEGADETLIHSGDPLDIELLEQERGRLTKMLRDQGYFNFSKNFIQYYADTVHVSEPEKARVLLSIVDNPLDTNAYKLYKIGDIKINFDYDALAIARGDTAYTALDYEGYEIKFNQKLRVKPKLILETIQFKRGELYSAKKVMDSYTRLQALNLFKFINIVFREEGVDESGDHILSCELQLTHAKRQSYNVFLEGTHNTGNIGVGGNFAYNNRNLFRGGENFTLSFWGALKKEQYKGGLFNTRELGVEAKLITPQFWMPFFRMKDFRKNMAPKTSISMSYSSEVTPFYDREIANAKFGYLWRKADKKWRYNVDLVDLNYVLMNNVDTEFRDSLKNEYVKSAYKSHLIFSAVFTSVFTDQVSNVPGSYNYFRTNLETSGNLLWGASHLLNKTRKESDDGIFYHVLGVPYAQFVKSDAEYIFNHYVNYANTLVYRFYIGCGYPYGNMKVLPFEEAFFGGGANGIRAWHSRTLGPGSHVSNDRYPNSVGEFKLEANIEYRYKLFWLLEGALFLDAGNVWNITKYEDRKGTKLSSDFYKEIAVGTGVGLRLDANVFVLRFDWGIKVKDPAQAAGQRFVLVDNGKWLKNTVFNIAIGYPF